MRLQALKTTLDGNVYTRKGEIVEVDDWKGRELIALGYAVEIPEPETAVAAPIAASSQRRDGDAFTALRAGGRDGSEKPASSSPAAQVRRRRTSGKRKAKRGS